ncbi:MAG: hypothetical protein WC803_12705 [Sphingomonas sp.]|jgi:hypothetical protein
MYKISDKDEQMVKRIYDEFSDMRTLRKKLWKYFNDRTLEDFVDDSQLRLNGYVPTKESQGKEQWQSNVFHPVTRNKFKAILAAVALDVPQTRITAQNEKSQRDYWRAQTIKELVKFSYDQDNKEEQVFFEAWEACEKGTVIVYDGYLRAKAKRKVVKSFDTITGEIETEEEEIETDSQCFNQIVPLMNLYIADFHVFNIQKQPSLIWIDRMTKGVFEKEYGKYKNAQYVPESVPKTPKNEDDTFFTHMWQERWDGEEPIEVLKYYNKLNDEFIILANGVLLLNAPLLLGKKKKWYPFAKTVCEPFSTEFFYGNSIPNLLMGEQDVINSLYNMALDKTYKSMAPQLLIGNANKDDFDLEDQNTTIDTKIYVQDISQVREMPITGVNQSDVKMIEIISRGLDLTSVDSNQQGVAGRGVTAREVVIANENAKKLKGILYMFLTSLWLQKIKLRIMNILVYYTKPSVQKILDKEGKASNILDEYRSFTVDNAELPDPNGEMTKGTLGIQIYPDQKSLPKQSELDIQEMKHTKQAKENYQVIAMTADYLDDWQYDVKVISESVFQTESSLSQSKMEDKLRILGAYFPQVIAQNGEKLAKDTITAFDDDPDEYELAPPPPAPIPGMPGQAPVPGADMATAGQAGMPPLPA